MHLILMHLIFLYNALFIFRTCITNCALMHYNFKLNASKIQTRYILTFSVVSFDFNLFAIFGNLFYQHWDLIYTWFPIPKYTLLSHSTIKSELSNLSYCPRLPQSTMIYGIIYPFSSVCFNVIWGVGCFLFCMQ